MDFTALYKISFCGLDKQKIELKPYITAEGLNNTAAGIRRNIDDN